jgi:DNA-binding transcriptional MerR regulator
LHPSETFRIGELARRTGRSIHAIRWYESQGLIPDVARDGAGWRVYREGHVRWLDLMHRLRSTGMSIAEMRNFTGLVKQGHVTVQAQRALLLAHRERVKNTIAEWEHALRLLHGKVNFYDTWIATGVRPKIAKPASLPAHPLRRKTTVANAAKRR